MLGSYEHRLVRVLELVTPTLTRGICFLWSLRGPMTLTPIAERLTVELSLPVFTTLVCRGWDSNV